MRNWTSRKVKISTKYSKNERRAIAYDIIAYIQKRTKDGKGKDNQTWKYPANKYSKEYKSSFEFKFKGDKSKVNLTLTGDMLDSIKRLPTTENFIRYGIPKGDPDNKKAEGNIRGSYGKSRGSRTKARDFLSLSDRELKKILKRYPLNDVKSRMKEAMKVISVLKEVDAKK